MSHRSLMVEVCADRAHYGFGPDDVFLQAPSTFDPAVLEFVRPIIDGTPLVLLEPASIATRRRWPRRSRGSASRPDGCSVVNGHDGRDARPGSAGGAPAWAKTLAKVSVGGEALPPSVAAQGHRGMVGRCPQSVRAD